VGAVAKSQLGDRALKATQQLRKKDSQILIDRENTLDMGNAPARERADSNVIWRLLMTSLFNGLSEVAWFDAADSVADQADATGLAHFLQALEGARRQ
jgi:hypothetical protein